MGTDLRPSTPAVIADQSSPSTRSDMVDPGRRGSRRLIRPGHTRQHRTASSTLLGQGTAWPSHSSKRSRAPKCEVPLTTPGASCPEWVTHRQLGIPQESDGLRARRVAHQRGCLFAVVDSAGRLSSKRSMATISVSRLRSAVRDARGGPPFAWHFGRVHRGSTAPTMASHESMAAST